jgi:hypothetical protein
MKRPWQVLLGILAVSIAAAPAAAQKDAAGCTDHALLSRIPD